MGYVDDVFIGPDPVERRHYIAWKRVARDLKAPAGMGESGHGSLRFGPLQKRQIPGRPVLNPLGTRIVLFFQTNEYQVPRMARGKARDLEIVVENLIRFGKRVILRVKNCFW